ncbi:MAG: cytochrome b/b6 domain-containing protein [Deltaproteobacteria bacterium]|nr:cytochrome b/b6 domain-containing protein [Deltaproteobacteria bacterium]
MRRVQVYSVFERLWHWLQAMSILLLFMTGAEIHHPSSVVILGFARAVWLHEWLAIFLVSNAFLSLFYHLATGALQKFIPDSRDFFSLAVGQAKFYLYGIFTGAPHPIRRAASQRLNVLQQLTYVLLLNVALPLQVATGILMWKADDWSSWVGRLGGLGVIAQVHVAMAWMMGAFVIMHVYLTTTGRTPMAHMRSMITGWEEGHEGDSEADSEADAKGDSERGGDGDGDGDGYGAGERRELSTRGARREDVSHEIGA